MAVTQIAFGRPVDYVGSPIGLALMGRDLTSQELVPGGTNQQSTAATLQCVARVATDTACYIAVGANPNATNTATRQFMSANTVLFVGLQVGDKVAVSTV